MDSEGGPFCFHACSEVYVCDPAVAARLHSGFFGDEGVSASTVQRGVQGLLREAHLVFRLSCHLYAGFVRDLGGIHAFD